jgi:hypothetical protein
LIGKDPREFPSEILSRYHREKNPLKALRPVSDTQGANGPIKK